VILEELNVGNIFYCNINCYDAAFFVEIIMD